eukprot:TRINITY_DN9174_c0_g1_i1.p1 TRINITY_DN9174_c0_g1~~TRINITY_DN9174_c0_g1_i1.p1  ORF type:complete len:287 (+),score=38.60 TRINITY_DN9174_c0_g1_i1:73-861(+)
MASVTPLELGHDQEGLEPSRQKVDAWTPSTSVGDLRSASSCPSSPSSSVLLPVSPSTAGAGEVPVLEQLGLLTAKPGNSRAVSCSSAPTDVRRNLATTFNAENTYAAGSWAERVAASVENSAAAPTEVREPNLMPGASSEAPWEAYFSVWDGGYHFAEAAREFARAMEDAPVLQPTGLATDAPKRNFWRGVPWQMTPSSGGVWMAPEHDGEDHVGLTRDPSEPRRVQAAFCAQGIPENDVRSSFGLAPTGLPIIKEVPSWAL